MKNTENIKFELVRDSRSSESQRTVLRRLVTG